MNFDKIDIHKLDGIVKSGTLENLPQEYQEYYNMMDLARGLRAKGVFNDKVVTKQDIVKLLMKQFNISDYQARRVYEDAINFFHSHENITADAYANLYAENLEFAAALALETNQLEAYHRLIKEAATLRGCYRPKQEKLPEELFRKPFVIYTTELQDVGTSGEDLKELEKIIDEIPDIPVLKRERLKSEAGIKGYAFQIMKQVAEDYEEFTEDGKTN